MLNTYNTARKKNSLTKFETLVFGMAAVLTLTAIVTSFVNSAYFEMIFNRDGGFIGYLTVLLLLIIFGISAVYIIRLSRYRSIQFCIVLILTGIFSLFFATQIMSDLPNLFHVSTHKLLKVNSTMLRANAGSIVKINAIGKVAFYWLFIAAGAFLFLILPFVYRSNFKAKRFIDKIGIPIPHRTHIIALVVLAILMVLFTEVSESEVLQFNLSAIFMLILLLPGEYRGFQTIGMFKSAF